MTHKLLVFLTACAAAAAQSFVPIDFPGAGSTQAWGINSHGEVVGSYVNPDATVHGFRLKRGQFSSIDFPGATNTQAYGINAQGDIVGTYAMAGATHGFLLTGGRFSTIDPPGASSSGPSAITPSGEITGLCVVGGLTRIFVLKGDQYEVFDYPGSSGSSGNGINARGDIVGIFNQSGVSRGYLRHGGEFSPIEFPAATATAAFGINSAGEIVGRYRDNANRFHGYLLTDGDYTGFDFPGATLTAGHAISSNGDVVGRYQKSDSVNHGFVYFRDSRPQYKVTDLGTLGGNASIAYGANNSGAIAGTANLPSQVSHGFLWSNGKMTDLGTLGGLNSATTNPNGAGQLTVIAETAKPDPDREDFCGWGTHQTCLAAIWNDGKLTALPTLGGNNAAGVVMNERGQTVGASETTTRDSACPSPQVFRFLPAFWDAHAATVRALPLPAGDTVGVAIGINDRGDAVGTTGTCDNTIVSAVGLLFGPRAVLWRKNGPATTLGHGVAASINNRGDVTGGSPVSEHEVHGFLWTSELGMLDLGTVGNDTSSFPTMINNSGQITGGSCDPDMNCRAFVWDPATTTMIDLNELAAGGPGLHLIFASWITEAGDVVGQAVDTKTGDLHAFLATPIRGGSTATVTSVPNAAPLPFTAREGLRQRLGAGAHSRRRVR
ncbi:MAG: hypothetical protein IT165_03970 [Bryobacterales bacterium]|nr:hypothetical protein [Bryobacterales bacterium]